MEEFQILRLAQQGWSTGPGGKEYGSTGIIFLVETLALQSGERQMKCLKLIGFTGIFVGLLLVVFITSGPN
jgi:hypothetical protein